MTTTLLPHNRTPWEEAIDRTVDARFPLPADLVKAVWSPDNCPPHLLAYLAFGLSVDLWDNDWPETTKREACRKALLLHRIKTTPAGVREHVKLAGSQVLKIVRPPAREHYRGAMTDAQREEWLAGLPQIRIYPFFIRSIAVNRQFYKGPGGVRGWHGVGFKRSTRGFNLYGKRATFYDRGAETVVIVGSTDFGLVDRVLLRRRAPNRVFYGHGWEGVGFVRSSVAETNVITVRLSDENQAFAVNPSAEPVDVRPKRIAQRRIAPAARAFFGRHGGFLRSSFGPLLIFDRIALHDPSRLGARRKVRSFHGHGRFGIDPFHAEVKVRVPMTRRRRTSGKWHGSGFRRAANMAALAKAIEAVRTAKAFRDTVLIDTATIGQVKFASGLRFGEFVFGQMKEV